MLYCLVNIIILNFDQNVFLGQFLVRFSKCYDTQVSVTGPSWPSWFLQIHVSATDMTIFWFPDDNLSKCRWIFTKFCICIDIVEMWFGIAFAKFSQFFDTVVCLQHDIGGILLFHIFAHLSWRLTRWAYSISMVGCPSYVVRHVSYVVHCPSTLLNIFSSETPGPFEVRFYVEHLCLMGTKVYIIGPGHMTKVAAMSIYGKTL